MLIGRSRFLTPGLPLADQLAAALERGFHGLAILSDGPAPPTKGIEAARKASGAGCPVVSWGALLPVEARGAAGTAAGAAAVAAALPQAGAFLRAVGAETLVVSPGSHVRSVQGTLEPRAAEQALESLARFVHVLGRSLGGFRIALAVEAAPAGLLAPDRLALLFEDPSLRDLQYWHDTAAAEAREVAGLDQAGDWLDRFGRRMAGATLHDFSNDRDGRLPGEGSVDWQLLAEYLPQRAHRVLALAPSYPDEKALEARAALTAFGIR